MYFSRLASMTSGDDGRAAATDDGPPRQKGWRRCLALATCVGVLLAMTTIAIGSVSSVAWASAKKTCNDSWVGPSTGGPYSWSDSTYWSNGTPQDSSVACITEDGTYTVLISHDSAAYVDVEALQVGAASGNPTLEVYANDGGVTLTLDGGAITVGGNGTHGTLAVDTTTSGGVTITGTPGVRGTSLTVASGGDLSVSGPPSGSPFVMAAPLTNLAGGIVDISSEIQLGLDNLGHGVVTVNSGAFDVAGQGTAEFMLGSRFTQSAGTLKVAGTLTLAGAGTAFVLAGGTESGRVIDIGAGATLVEGAGKAVGFDVTGYCNLTGDIPAGQTVTVDGHSNNSSVGLTGSTTVKGTLALDASAKGWAQVGQANHGASLTVAKGGRLSTSGPSSGTPVAIYASLTNRAGGTVDIAADTELGPVTYGGGSATVNWGTFDVARGGQVVLGSGSTLVNKATGRLGVTVVGSPKRASGVSGAGVTLKGTLAVATVGSPPVGSTFVVIGGPVTGRFSAYAFGRERYSVRYGPGGTSSDEVILTVRGKARG